MHFRLVLLTLCGFACYAKGLLFICFACYVVLGQIWKQHFSDERKKHQPIACIWTVKRNNFNFLFNICVRSKHAKSCNSKNQVVEHCQPFFALHNACEGVFNVFHASHLPCECHCLSKFEFSTLIVSLEKPPFWIWKISNSSHGSSFTNHMVQ
jgi:hypothetical protein